MTWPLNGSEAEGDFALDKDLSDFVMLIKLFYYMASVCSRYNARSDWLSAASRQGIILP